MKNQSSRISLKKRNNKEQPVNPSCISHLSSGGDAFPHHTAAVEGTSWLFRLYPTALKSFASIWPGYVGACCTGVYWLLYFMHGRLREMQSVLADGDNSSLPELAYIVICCLKVTCFSYPFSDVWFLPGLETCMIDDRWRKMYKSSENRTVSPLFMGFYKILKNPKILGFSFLLNCVLFCCIFCLQCSWKNVHPRKK